MKIKTEILEWIVNLILILILILCIIYIISDLNEQKKILLNDNDYFEKFSEKKVSKLINNNKLIYPIRKKNKILFITYDNRYQEEYVQIHNYNLKKYTEHYGYEYKFYNRCNDNVYWCKIFMVLDALEKNLYDYVVWFDSDTIIKNFSIDIGDVFNKFSSDIFIGLDNNKFYDITNAGVFGIANTPIGIKFLNDCIELVSDSCVNSDGSLKGIWAASCYEQGIMNILIADKYSKYTTVLTNDIIFNYNVCSNDVFIMHLYASSPSDRVKCFYSKNRELNFM